MKDLRTRPEEYPDSYAYRINHQWKCLDLDEGYAEVVSRFCPVTPDWVTFPADWVDDFKKAGSAKTSKGKPIPITGKVFTPPESDFEVMYDLDKAMSLVVDKLFTKKFTRGVRCTPRKEFLEMKEYETYMWISLLDYLRQCKRENSNKCLLSRKEIAILQPTLTKKEEKKRSINKALRDNFISY